MENVLIIGSGAREQALAWKLSQSERIGSVFLLPGNAGSNWFSKCKNFPLEGGSKITEKDFERIADLSVTLSISLIVVGPEDLLALGIVDFMSARGHVVFGPSRDAARIESSKVFAKRFMRTHDIPTGRFDVFTNGDAAEAHIRAAEYKAYVVKADGLAAGKGVFVASNVDEAVSCARRMLDGAFGEASKSIVVEELLEGEEVSVLAFSDGQRILAMPPVQDHKRAMDNDAGPNTGGMGACGPYPLDDPTLAIIRKDVILRAVRAMAQEGTPFHGVLFAGIMLTSDGPKVLEFNARFGDPETQVLVTLMRNDFDLYEVMLECARGSMKSMSASCFYTDQFAVGVCLASGGYPDSFQVGFPIVGLAGYASPMRLHHDARVFHAGTRIDDATGRLLTNGGRVLTVVGVASSAEEAQRTVYDVVSNIQFDGVHYRKDIGARAIARLRQLSKSTAEDSTVPQRRESRPEGAKTIDYKASGVDTDLADQFISRIVAPAAYQLNATCAGVFSEIGQFGGLFDLAPLGFTDPILVSGTDGVGTKLKVAQAVNRHFEVGIDLVAMSVNDVLAHGAQPLFFLDYFACASLSLEVGAQLVAGIAEGCRQAHCALIGGETAEMPSLYQTGEYDLAGFAVAAVERSRVLPALDTIVDGDALIGIASSGLHSNGFSLVRSIVNRYYADAYNHTPCPWSPSQSLGHALLTPTTIYVKALLPLMKGQDSRSSQGQPSDRLVKAYAHITGGGILENLPRSLPRTKTALIDASRWTIPPVFGWVRVLAGLSAREMARTFNCGLGALLVVAGDHVEYVLEQIRLSGFECWQVGTVCERIAQEVDVEPAADLISTEHVVIEHLEKAFDKAAASIPDLLNLHKLKASIDFEEQRVTKAADGIATSHTQHAQLCASLGVGVDILRSPITQPKRIGVLLSGGGTNLQALIDNQTRYGSYQIVLVISNVRDAAGLQRAQMAGIATRIISHRSFTSREQFDETVDEALRDASVDIVCLCGFMRILTDRFVESWRGRLLNVHPSLLPSFRGAHAHADALKAGVRVTGATVHFVDVGEVDTGATILQRATPVLPTDCLESLSERVKRDCEHCLFPRALDLVARGFVRLDKEGRAIWDPRLTHDDFENIFML